MKFILQSIVVLLVLVSCTRSPIQVQSVNLEKVKVNLDLWDIENDTFRVEVVAPALTAENNIYQFASTAPGTYQVMNIGRFVSDFKAYDKKGQVVPTAKMSTNQYRLTKPASVKRITYKIAETWDTPVDKNPVYRMCGTSIENDHILINTHAIIGYFKGLQSRPLELKLDYPAAWMIGTPLLRGSDGTYSAKSYDYLVDSPILLGKLSKASTTVDGTKIEIYTYSKTGRIESDMILDYMSDLLIAANNFLEGLPVDHYTFLYHFEDVTYGAWEHSYSSAYIYREDDWDALKDNVLATAAHEFFHIVTPLNIHSELIESFNFVTPQPSDHLWLYEAVTEWASDMILLHGNNISPEEYLDRIEEKLFIDNLMYSGEYSLVELARTSFTEEGHAQYGSIYQKGAVIAALMDLRILKLSGGERGLRDLIIELTKAYGPDKPFSEKDFFAEIVERTYPELEEFINNYIKKNKPLPLKEYYAWAGIDYATDVEYPDVSDLGLFLYPTSEGHYVYMDPPPSYGSPLKQGDLILSINGSPFTAATSDSIMAVINKMPVGTEYDLVFIRDGQPVISTATTVMDVDAFALTLQEDASPEQLHLRKRLLEGTYSD